MQGEQPSARRTKLSEPLRDDDEARQRRKKVALFLAALVVVLLVIFLIWWGNLADPQIEEGPVGPVEAITDSADD